MLLVAATLGRPPEYGSRFRTECGAVVSLLRQFCLAPGLLLGERDHFGEARFAAKVAVVDPTHLRQEVEEFIELSALIGIESVVVTPAPGVGIRLEEPLEAVAHILPHARFFPMGVLSARGFVVRQHAVGFPKHERYTALPILRLDALPAERDVLFR